MNKIYNTILLDFLLGTIIIISVFFAILTFINISNQKSIVLESISNNISDQSVILREIARNNLKSGNIRDIQILIMNLKDHINKHSDNSIDELTVYKKNNDEIIYFSSTNYDKIGTLFEDYPENFINRLEKEKLLLETYKKNNMEYFSYIFSIYDNDNMIGFFEYKINSKGIEFKYKKSMVSNVGTAIISILLIILFTTILLYFRIYNPISTLVNEVKKIRKGDLTHDIKLGIKNELGELAKEINLMKSYIWESSLDNRMVNPLTGLKGLMETIIMINEKLDKKEIFGIVSINLKNTEPYKIKFGLNSLEAIITIVLETANDVIEELNIKKYNLMHLSETNFILITDPEYTEDFSKKFIDGFDIEILSLYRQKTKEGVITFKDKDGEESNYSMIIAQLGIINTTENRENDSYKDIEDKILEIEEVFYNKTENSFYVTYSKDGMEENGRSDDNKSEMELEELNLEDLGELETLELDEDLLVGLDEI